jgi:hypothetical protein
VTLPAGACLRCLFLTAGPWTLLLAAAVLREAMLTPRRPRTKCISANKWIQVQETAKRATKNSSNAFLHLKSASSSTAPAPSGPMQFLLQVAFVCAYGAVNSARNRHEIIATAFGLLPSAGPASHLRHVRLLSSAVPPRRQHSVTQRGTAKTSGVNKAAGQSD